MYYHPQHLLAERDIEREKLTEHQMYKDILLKLWTMKSKEEKQSFISKFIEIDKINFISSFVEQINKLYDKGVVDFPTMLERNGKFEVQKENCSLKNQIELKDVAIKGLKENLYYEK